MTPGPRPGTRIGGSGLLVALLAVLLAAQVGLGRALDAAAAGARPLATGPTSATSATGESGATRETLGSVTPDPTRPGTEPSSRARPPAPPLPGPPPAWIVRWAMLGEARAAAYLVSLRLQIADAQRGVGADAMRVSELDPATVLRWLDHALALDPTTAYPLLLAARVHAEVHGADGGRPILQWLRARFDEDPDRRWPWLVHGVYVARHVFGDLPLAVQLAADLRRRANGPAVPSWVRQVEPLLLADMGQLEAARTLVGALVTSGAVREPSELSFLAARLRELEQAGAGADPSMASSRHRKGVSRE